jgi:hypothetical protein
MNVCRFGGLSPAQHLSRRPEDVRRRGRVVRRRVASRGEVFRGLNDLDELLEVLGRHDDSASDDDGGDECGARTRVLFARMTKGKGMSSENIYRAFRYTQDRYS